MKDLNDDIVLLKKHLISITNFTKDSIFKFEQNNSGE